MSFNFRCRTVATSLLFAAALTHFAHANDKLVLQTTWVAQAEQGGYYQAVATGIYKKYGLDVDVRAGGPQLNNMTLLLAKRADVIVSYDLQVLKGIEQHFPLKAIAAPFQFDPQGLLTHGNVKNLDDLTGKTILVSASGQASWWPWLKTKYHLKDSQVRPYTFNMQPFLADKNTAQQAYATSEVQQAKQASLTVNSGCLPNTAIRHMAAFWLPVMICWQRNPMSSNALLKPLWKAGKVI